MRLKLPRWSASECGRKIFTKYEFQTEGMAEEWVALVKSFADQKHHHPDWNRKGLQAAVELTTHSARGLTRKDFELAAAMDRFEAKVKNK